MREAWDELLGAGALGAVLLLVLSGPVLLVLTGLLLPLLMPVLVALGYLYAVLSNLRRWVAQRSR